MITTEWLVSALVMSLTDSELTRISSDTDTAADNIELLTVVVMTAMTGRLSIPSINVAPASSVSITLIHK